MDPQTGVSLRPLPFHAANLLIHVVTACVVYRLLLRLVGRPWPALAGAMLFAIHPVQVESVASVSGIQGLLCGMFGLSAVLQYTHFAAPDPGDRPWLRYAFAVALFVCSVLSKPLGTMVPVIAGLVDVFFLRHNWRAAVRSLWPWVVVALPYVILTKLIQPDKQLDVEVPCWTRPFIAADAVTFYLYKIVFPVWLGLFYGRTPGSVLKHDAIFYMWLVPAAIAIAPLAATRSTPGADRRGTHLPRGTGAVSGLVRFNSQQYSTVSDHYLYLPMFGVALAAAWALARSWCGEPGRRGRVTLVCAVLLGDWPARRRSRRGHGTTPHAVPKRPVGEPECEGGEMRRGNCRLSMAEWLAAELGIGIGNRKSAIHASPPASRLSPCIRYNPPRHDFGPARHITKRFGGDTVALADIDLRDPTPASCSSCSAPAAAARARCCG